MEFIHSFRRLNLASLTSKKNQEVVKKTGVTQIEKVEVYEYGKNNNSYWDEANLHQQVVNKESSIAERLYFGCSLLFLFDNATGHSIYEKSALKVKNMNEPIETNNYDCAIGGLIADIIELTNN